MRENRGGRDERSRREGEERDGKRGTGEDAEVKDDARERAAPQAAVVYEAIRREGEDELARPMPALFFSGLAAGLSMGFSLMGEGLLRRHLPEAPWSTLVAELGYSFGFLIVILGRQQLFTENTLTPVLPLLRAPGLVKLGKVLRLWGVVLAANLIGTAAFALVATYSDVFEPETRAQFLRLGAEVIERDLSVTLIGAGFAGWLIALMVWLLPFAETARVLVIVAITWLIGVGGFAHVIAGSVDVWCLVWAGRLGLGGYFGSFLVPTLAGNLAGGLLLVTAINHAQVKSGQISD